MISQVGNKFSKPYALVDKENQQDIVNTNAQDSQMMNLNKLRQRQSSSNDLQGLQHSRTEESFKDIARKVNADKVKRSLNTYNQEGGKDLHSLTTLQNEVEKLSLNECTEPQVQFPKEFSTIVEEPKYCYKTLENQNLLNTYSGEILDYIMVREKDSTPVNSLIKHNIPVNLRAKMVDWMIEVLSSYKCTEQTFFMSVRVMDLFFNKTTKPHEVSDLHLVGVTSMFIGCKYEEIYPMKLQVVHEKIAHKKLSIDQIKLKESEILAACNFQLIGTTPFELAMHCLSRTTLSEQLDKKIYAYLEKICTYLSKMILYDYELIQNKTYSLLAASLIFVSFKIIEQIDSTFKAEEKIKSVIKILKVQHESLIETAAKILTLAKSFDKLYPNLDNLKKFNGFSLDEDSSKKN